jgi:hypothetical protein
MGAIVLLPFLFIGLFVLIHFRNDFGKPIYSKYIGFNTRDVIYEYRGGRRVVRRIHKAFGDSFPIPTSISSNDHKLFNQILNNNISESNKVSLAIDYKVCGEGDTRLIGSKFMHLINTEGW